MTAAILAFCVLSGFTIGRAVARALHV